MKGIERIRQYLGEHKGNYVIIGGTACNLNLEEANLQGRATKDVDMIVVCEAITPRLSEKFLEFHPSRWLFCMASEIRGEISQMLL